NLCLLCAAHNADAARKAFGDVHIEAKRAERAERQVSENQATTERARSAVVFDKVRRALAGMGFPNKDVARLVAYVRQVYDSTWESVPLAEIVRAALIAS